jgi:chromosome partitioning protein
VDNDAQASLSSGVFGAAAVEQFDPASTIAAIYAGDDPHPRQVIRPSGLPGVDVLAGSMAAAKYNNSEPYLAPLATQRLLREFLDEVRDAYDHILIDNPPNLAAANWAAMVASDYLVIPIVPEDYGSMSLSPVLSSIQLVMGGPNPAVRLLGLAMTMVQPRLGIHIAYETSLRENYGDGVFAARIMTAADVKEAISKKLPVTHYKPKGASAKGFIALKDEILARIESGRGIIESESAEAA